MNKRLHLHTISLLDQFIWKKPGRNVITRIIDLERESGKLPAGDAFIEQLNGLLQSENFTRYARYDNYRNKTDIRPIKALQQKITDLVSLSFKNTYQFAAFVLLADSRCPKENTDQMDGLLQQLKPDFIQFGTSMDISEEDGEYITPPDDEINITVFFECAPDHILRSKQVTSYAHFDELFKVKDYFQEGIKVMEYFMDNPFDQIPEMVFQGYFSYGMIHHLSKTYPDHPIIPFWIRRAITRGYHQKFGHSNFLQFMPEADRQDKETVLLFVSANGLELEYAAPSLQQDNDIVEAAIAQNGYALLYADPSFHYDLNLVERAIDNNPRAIFCLEDPKAFNHDTYGFLLQKALLKDLKLAEKLPAAAFETYPELLHELIVKNADSIRFAPIAYRSDKNLARELLTLKPLALEHFDISIQSDKELVSLAVQLNGLALQFASPQLRGDETIIEQAILQNKKSFVFANEALPDRETVLRWINIQPLIVLHMNLINRMDFDDELMKAYITGIINLKNEDVLSLPQGVRMWEANEDNDTDLDDLF
jgi:hypothetical protein